VTIDVVMDVKKEIAELKARVSMLENARKDPEGNLSVWAKKQLAEARKAPRSSYVSLDELDRKINAKRRKVRA
jgi:hypothetical protein